MTELVLEALRTAPLPPLRGPEAGKQGALLRVGGAQLHVYSSVRGPETQDAAACGARWPQKVIAGSAGRQSGPGCGVRCSDAEALLTAVDVAQPKVDVRADALQGLQPEGPAQVLGVRPGCGQPKAKPMHGA